MRAAVSVSVLFVVGGCHARPPEGDPSPPDAPVSPPPAAFVHVVGDQLVDGEDRPLLLRAMGLGNWLLPEGYMWQLDGARGDRPRRIEQRIVELIGAERAAAFWTAYRDRFVTEADIARMHELGFNAVRLAINARQLMPEGGSELDEHAFSYLTRTVEWGSAHGVYVVFDMHAAPGGQTGRNIDDSANDQPELFTEPENQVRLVTLWTEIARRFVDSPTVLGYDLLNEPIAPEFEQFDDRLWPIYQRIAEAIRAVDRNHVLIVEGAQWANDWTALHEPFDDNLIYSFHKYWDDTSTASIQGYLDHRALWGRPLWTGEIGENDDDWYRAAFATLEANDVGWAFWSWKKLDSDNNPYAIPRPADWDRIQAFVDDPAAQPSPAVAQAILDELVENVALEHCRYNEHAACAVVPCP